MVRVLCIYDEGAVVDTPLIGAKGFSVMVESEGRRIMMDTGLRDRYLVHNMETSIPLLWRRSSFPRGWRRTAVLSTGF